MIDNRFWKGMYIGWLLATLLMGSAGTAAGYFIGYGHHSNQLLKHMEKINNHLINLEKNFFFNMRKKGN